jgi:SAM-dependent methyltransferase
MSGNRLPFLTTARALRCSVAARRPHFYRPNARKGPFGSLTDEAVQLHGLNPTRLAYMAKALRNTTCRDASSACFRSPSNRFADVGCGSGLATSGLALTHGFNVVGVDILDDAVSWAAARVQASDMKRLESDEGAEGTVTFIKGSAYSLPFSDRSLDGSRKLVLLQCLPACRAQH